jgi:hypothetical protein
MTKFDGEPLSAIGPRTMASERLACRVLGQHRSTQRKPPKGRADDAALTADIVALATQYGRYGYRRIASMLQQAGWAVNVKRVERRDLVRHWSKDNGRAASGGAQSARETTEKRPALAERRLLRAASSRAPQPCLVLTTSSRTALTTAGSSACSTSSTSSPGSAWRSGSTGG